MTTVNTVPVTTSPTLVFGASPNSGGVDSVQILNLDTVNTVYVGYGPSISATLGGQSIPVEPLGSMTFGAAESIYAVAAEPLTIGVTPGGTAYSPGSLAITGPVTAEITGPITVEGSVGITGTPDVGISGTVDVQFPSAQDVSITNASIPTTVTGTVDTNVTNTANVSVTNSPVVSVSNTVATSVSNDVSVQNASGGSLTVAGSVSIGNTPSVTVTGTPSVSVASGTVSIGNTPAVTLSGSSNQVTVASGNVNIANTPAVTLSGTPNVAISSGTVNATLTGTSNVNVANASIDVIGAGGYILPGQVAQVFSGGSISVAAGTVWNSVNSSGGAGVPFNVSAYQSVDIAITTATGSTATGSAYCAQIEIAWYDSTASYLLGNSVFAVPVGGTFNFSVPCVGPDMILSIQNIGSSSSISVTKLLVYGSYRVLTEFQWNTTPLLNLASDSTIAWGSPESPVGQIDRWVCTGGFSIVNSSIPTGIFLVPCMGPVNGYYQVSTASFSNDPVVIDMSFQVRGGIVAGTGNSGVLMNIPSATATNPTLFTQNFPVCVPAIIIKSTSATSNLQFTAVQQ